MSGGIHTLVPFVNDTMKNTQWNQAPEHTVRQRLLGKLPLNVPMSGKDAKLLKN